MTTPIRSISVFSFFNYGGDGVACATSLKSHLQSEAIECEELYEKSDSAMLHGGRVMHPALLVGLFFFFFFSSSV